MVHYKYICIIRNRYENTCACACVNSYIQTDSLYVWCVYSIGRYVGRVGQGDKVDQCLTQVYTVTSHSIRTVFCQK